MYGQVLASTAAPGVAEVDVNFLRAFGSTIATYTFDWTNRTTGRAGTYVGTTSNSTGGTYSRFRADTGAGEVD